MAATKLTARTAIQAIDRLGACLVYPLPTRADPPSLWSTFFPRSEMRWDWDAFADPRVAELWHLRTALSESGKVVYAKWYRGRATFFSVELFTALVRVLPGDDEELGLSDEALRIYRAYEEKSPLSTKEAKRAADLRGRVNERAWNRGMKELWTRLLVVGFGERQDGAFPSLEVGASKWLHEPAWRIGRALPADAAWATIGRYLPEKSAFRKELDRATTRLPGRPRATRP